MNKHTRLTAAIAEEQTAGQPFSLEFVDYTAITDTAARVLGELAAWRLDPRDKPGLNLNGLTSLSDVAAKHLARCRYDLSLRGLNQLSDAAVDSLG